MQFKVERWRNIEREVLGIIDRHWLELAVEREHIPLDLDCEIYRKMDEMGILHICTVRDGAELAGYYVSIVRPHPHYKSTMFAFQDAFFLVPEHRRGTVGMEFIEFMEQAVKQAGAKCIIASTKAHFDVSPLFLRMGWKKREIQFQKWVGE